MTDPLDSFLASNFDVKPNPGGQKCICCTNLALAADITGYLDRLMAGTTQVPLRFFHEGYVVKKYGRPQHVNSLYHHIRMHLRRDRVTGQELTT